MRKTQKFSKNHKISLFSSSENDVRTRLLHKKCSQSKISVGLNSLFFLVISVFVNRLICVIAANISFFFYFVYVLFEMIFVLFSMSKNLINNWKLDIVQRRICDYSSCVDRPILTQRNAKSSLCSRCTQKIICVLFCLLCSVSNSVCYTRFFFQIEIIDLTHAKQDSGKKFFKNS